ncbi:adenylate/guanylate cyclase domain-containing protein [Salinispira pacifica]|uniref:Adenylate cyclase n=1 Tax=Salinispira pacifica TaxID=1307761 RepID=V5WEE2_9SPIO|nr:adenylate/guanylate cyclase domain-containing protein [Salinispira pacifica]AHC14177.1 Adenylate cyclase [Salinispira pacifica]
MKETRLMAVMFTDIAEFSRMMEEDEKRTIELLEEHHGMVFPIIENFNGRLIDSVGDGLLLTFESLLGAVSCALNIQNAVAERNASVEPGRKFNLRIGLHMGDIWFEENNIYGNGVNIAARLQQMSKPGGICVSEDVYHQIKNKDSVQFQEVPNPGMKNISRDFRIFYVKTGHEETILNENREGNKASGEERSHEGDGSSAGDEHRGSGGTKSGSSFLGMDVAEIIKDAISTGFNDSKEERGEKKSRLEQKIENFVEKTLDFAVNSWENMPEEKKNRVMAELKDKDWYVDINGEGSSPGSAGGASAYSSSQASGTRPDTEGSSSQGRDEQADTNPGGFQAVHRFNPEGSADNDAGSRHRPRVSKGGIDLGDLKISFGDNEPKEEDKTGDMVFGLLAGSASLWGILANGSPWFYVTFFFLGLLPLVFGIVGTVKNFGIRKRRKQKEALDRERRVLSSASAHGGMLTVVQCARAADLGFEEAEKELERLCTRGWVVQDFNEEGTVVYRFPALPGTDAAD